MASKRDAEDANLSPKDPGAKSNKMDGDETVKGAICGLRSILQRDVETVSQKIGEIYVSQSETVDAVQFQGGFIETVSRKLLDLEKKQRDSDRKMEDLTDELRATQEELSKVKVDVNENKKELKSNNMVISGFPEKPSEKCIENTVTFLRKLVPELKAEHIVTAYRLGRKGGDGEVNRSMFVKFREPEMKRRIMQQKGKMYKDKELGMRRVFCNGDLSEEKRILRQEMREIAKYAVGNGFPDARVMGEKLLINGVTYQEDELGLLPEELKMENIRTRLIGPGIGFFSKHSYLSNFFPAKLVVNGQRFVHSEQAYQYSKAVICGRDDIAKSVKSCIDPKKIKKYGDKAESKPEWEEIKCETMKCILLAKFTQNDQLREKLISTGTTPLLECTTNLYWGTGWKFDEEGWSKGAKYPGKNKLGLLLSEVRELLTVKGHSHKPFTDLQKLHMSTLADVHQTAQRGITSSELTPIADHNKSSEKAHKKEGWVTAPLPVEAQPTPICSGDNKQGSTEEAEDAGKLSQAAGGSDVTASGSEIMELEEADGSSLSFDSEMNRSSFNSRSIMKADGHLDHEKMRSWALPTVNMSNLRRLASESFPDLARTYGGEEHDHNKRALSLLAHSTPVTHVTSRRTKKAKKKLETLSATEEKRNLIRMLNKFKSSNSVEK